MCVCVCRAVFPLLQVTGNTTQAHALTHTQILPISLGRLHYLPFSVNPPPKVARFRYPAVGIEATRSGATSIDLIW